MGRYEKAARTLEEWDRLLGDERGPLYDRLREIYGDDEPGLREKAGLLRRALAGFADAFGAGGKVILVRSAGRVNLMGMHVDHRGGWVHPIAIREVLTVARARTDDRVAACNAESERFPRREFSISGELPAEPIPDWDLWTQEALKERVTRGEAGDWINYVKSSALYLQETNKNESGGFDPVLRGMDFFVMGNLPIAAGLSSSSSIVVAALDAMICVNELTLTDSEYIDACAIGEWYVGTRGGAGDHAAIKFARRGSVCHIGSHPLTTEVLPLPDGYTILLCNSLVEAKKTEGAKNFFNNRIGSYTIGQPLIKKHFPEHAEKIGHLRDVDPETLGVDDAVVYEMIKSLPEVMDRAEALAALPESRAELEKIFSTHDEPPGGYQVRQVCAYGITECLRSRIAGDTLREGDLAGFAETINVSHDGDRVSRYENGTSTPTDTRVKDELLDRLIHDSRSNDPERVERSRLFRLPGGYAGSTPEIDQIVDTVLTIPGVAAAGLVGAGLGGCAVVLCEEKSAPDVIQSLTESYYHPRGLEPAAEVIDPVGGAGVIEGG